MQPTENDCAQIKLLATICQEFISHIYLLGLESLFSVLHGTLARVKIVDFKEMKKRQNKKEKEEDTTRELADTKLFSTTNSLKIFRYSKESTF